MNRPATTADRPAVRLGGPLATRHAVTATGPLDAPVVLLVHGFGCDQGMWRGVLPALAEDHRVVAFDHLGSGRSRTEGIDPAGYADLSAWSADLLALVEELGLRGATLVAHSVSAMMAIEVAVQRPELLRQLVLIAPSPRFLDDPADGYTGGFSAEDLGDVLGSMDSNYFSWAAAMAPAVVGDAGAPELTADLEASFCRTDPDFARALARAGFTADYRPLLDRVSTPVLILEGSEDLLVPPAVSQHLLDHLVGSVRVQLRARGHCPHLTGPRETAAAIREHLLTLR
jgi:sigma-B regulation protein RsbQ